MDLLATHTTPKPQHHPSLARCDCICSIFITNPHIWDAMLRTRWPKRMDIMGDWRKLHSKELHNLCSLPNILWMIKSRMMRWVRQVAWMGERIEFWRNSYICSVHHNLHSPVVVGKSQWNRPLGRPRLRWEDTKINCNGTGVKGANWIQRVQAEDTWKSLWTC